jgi:hypothetical protein
MTIFETAIVMFIDAIVGAIVSIIIEKIIKYFRQKSD